MVKRNRSELVIPADMSPDAPEWAGALDEAIFVGDAERWPKEFEAWRVTDRGSAEWAMRMLGALETRAREVKAQAKVWRSPIDMWEHDELKRVDGAIHRFTTELEVWGMAEREAHPETPTLKLPSGEVSTRLASEPSINLVPEAEEELIEWLADNVDSGVYDVVVKQVQSVYISELRKIVHIEYPSGCAGGFQENTVVLDNSGGLQVPGVTIDAAQPKPTVKPLL